MRGIFLTLFNWSCQKSEFFSSLWLIRSATSIQTVFTVIIGKNFSADFHLNTGVRGLFLTLFLIFWKEWCFLILMTNKDCYLYTNSFHSHHCKKKFSADFHLKTGVRELFLTLFNWSSEKSEFFSSSWLIRCATSIQTVFTVIIGKKFSADFHLNTGVRGLFLTLFFGLLKRVKFFDPYDLKGVLPLNKQFSQSSLEKL